VRVQQTARFMATWNGVIKELIDEGQVKHVGGDHLQVWHMERILEQSTHRKVEFNLLSASPSHGQFDTIRFSQSRNIECIVLMKTTFLGGDETAERSRLGDAGRAVETIAERIGRTPLQVEVTWWLQRGVLVLPVLPFPDATVNQSPEKYNDWVDVMTSRFQEVYALCHPFTRRALFCSETLVHRLQLNKEDMEAIDALDMDKAQKLDMIDRALEESKKLEEVAKQQLKISRHLQQSRPGTASDLPVDRQPPQLPKGLQQKIDKQLREKEQARAARRAERKAQREAARKQKEESERQAHDIQAQAQAQASVNEDTVADRHADGQEGASKRGKGATDHAADSTGDRNAGVGDQGPVITGDTPDTEPGSRGDVPGKPGRGSASPPPADESTIQTTPSAMNEVLFPVDVGSLQSYTDSMDSAGVAARVGADAGAGGASIGADPDDDKSATMNDVLFPMDVTSLSNSDSLGQAHGIGESVENPEEELRQLLSSYFTKEASQIANEVHRLTAPIAMSSAQSGSLGERGESKLTPEEGEGGGTERETSRVMSPGHLKLSEAEGDEALVDNEGAGAAGGLIQDEEPEIEEFE